MNAYSLFFLPFFSFVMKAQVQLSGKIVQPNQVAVALAEVQLTNKDSISTNSKLTNHQGLFVMAIEKGTYRLKVLQLGVIRYQKTIELNSDTNLGNITITEEKQLQEVVVTNQKKLIDRKIDKLVFNVENSISTKGGTAIDALKLTPKIKVQHNKIEMIGKSKMSVMIDDKFMQISGDDLIIFLNSISADNIKSIEVIATPPAKYDAEGNSGIVNIKLKKAKKDNWSSTIRNATTKASYWQQTNGINFMYQKNKWSLQTDLALGTGTHFYNNDINYRHPDNEYWQSENILAMNRKYISHNVSIDYKVNNRWNLSLQYNGTLTPQENNEQYNTDIFENISQKKSLFRYKTNGSTMEQNNTHSLNFKTICTLDTIGKKITFDIDYLSNFSDKKNPFSTTNTNYTANVVENFYNQNFGKQSITNFSSRIDFEMPYAWTTLNYGAKASFTTDKASTKADFYKAVASNLEPFLLQQNTFDYNENNQALYLSVQKTLGKKWELKAGLRLESTQTKGYSQELNQTNTNRYTKLFPTLYIAYKSNENNSLNIDYARRIGRPSYWELNPAKWYQNLNETVYGNPFLQPSFSNDINVSHAYKSLLNTSFWVSFGENSSGQITINEEPNIVKIEYLNYFNFTNIGISETVNFSFFKWWTNTTTTSFYLNTIKTFTPYLNPTYSGNQADVSTNNIFTLNKSKTLAAELNFLHHFRSSFGEITTLSYSSLDLGCKYATLKNKLNIGLVLNNILKSDIAEISSITQGINQSFRQYYDTRFVRLSLSYKFGGSTINLEKKESGNEEEKGRIVR